MFIFIKLRLLVLLIILVIITNIVSAQQIQLNIYKVSDNTLVSASNPICSSQPARFEFITLLNNVTTLQDGTTDITITFQPTIINGVTYYKWVDPLNHTYTGFNGPISISFNFKLADNTLITASATHHVTALPVANFIANTQVCANTETTFTDASTANPTQWFWDFGDGNTSNVQNPKHTYTTAGNYQVKLRVTNQYNCTSDNIAEQTVKVYPQPKLEFSTAQFCLDRPFQITTARETTGIKGTMAFSGPGVSQTGFFDTQAAGAGNHNVTCTFTSENGCKVSKTQILTVSPLPNVQFGSTTIPVNTPTKINPTYEGTISRYHWIPEDGLDDPESPNPVFNLNEDKVYQLVLTSDAGCIMGKTVEIKVIKKINVIKKLEIPNVFTPNGDRKNDTWIIKNLSLYKNIEVRVFNRWGTIVYQSIDNTAQWDGKNINPGTYYYVIKADDETYSGYVMILVDSKLNYYIK